MLLFAVGMYTLVLISIPVHEMGHVIAYRMLGYRGKLNINWFSFSPKDGASGFVQILENFRIEGHPILVKLAVFFVGFFGGGFVAILFISSALFIPHLLPTVNVDFWSQCRIPILIVGFSHLVYGVVEGREVLLATLSENKKEKEQPHHASTL